jgi:Flp pilus assembly protein TadB
MAQTKKKRRRSKHRGTQAGTIERPGRTGRPTGDRPAPKGDSRAAARQRRQERFDREPTWRSSLNRAAFASAILAIFVSVVQKNVAAGVVLGVLALVIYVPMSYYTDRALWRRRMRQKQQAAGKRPR